MHSTHTRMTTRRAVCLGLSFAMLSPSSVGLFTPASAAAPVAAAAPAAAPSIVVRSVLVFPSANDAGATADTAGVAAKLDAAIKFRLDTVGKIKVTYFSHHLPSVERAADDKVLSQDDITPPFNDAAKASKVANQVSTDAYLIEGVESYNWDAAGRKAVIEVSADLYNTTTGDHLKALAFTGHGAAFSNADNQATVTQYAVNDAASQIVSSLNSDVVSPVQKVSNSQRGSAGSVPSLIAVVLGGALLYAVFHKNSSNNNSSSDGTGTSTGTGSGSDTPPAAPF